MLCDAHCHPFDLRKYISDDNIESCFGKTAAASSSCTMEQFEYNENLSRRLIAHNNIPLKLCFAVHPQYPACSHLNETDNRRHIYDVLFPALEKLAMENRLDAVGEAGFDLFDDYHKNTEKTQDEIFAHHINIAIKYSLPMVIHVRKAMHKIFALTGYLKKLPAVVFHSWQGTITEGESLLRRNVNAYFSFGTAIINNHKQTQRCCARFPLDRLLFETDAPYMPLRGMDFSSWSDLPAIYRAASALRSSPVPETAIEANFAKVFSV